LNERKIGEMYRDVSRCIGRDYIAEITCTYLLL